MSAARPSTRDDAVAMLVGALTDACPTAEVSLIGSLATPGGADALSDIDVRWDLPSQQARGQLSALRGTLHRVGTLESLRVDPDPRTDELLVFVRFAGWPLWWRVDLEVHSPGLSAVTIAGADPWSSQESACMGVVVTLKALARGRPGTAEELFTRALRRAEAEDAGGVWPRRIDALLDHVGRSDTSTADLVARTRQLSRDVLGG